MKKLTHQLIGLSTLGLMTLFSSQVFASGYKMEFQSASVLADAGEAAVVEDAGTNWYNSAGLVYLPQQLVFSGIALYAPVRFNGTTTAPSPFGIIDPVFNYSATGTAHSHPFALIPGFHYSRPINPCLAVGVSVVPAWGFAEDYGNNSILRYNLNHIMTKSLDIAPSIAWKMNEQWSFGAGPDFNYFDASSKNHANTIGPAGFGGTDGDSISKYSANDWNVGWHAGVLFRPDNCTRIGLNYRSKIVMHLTGDSEFDVFEGAIYKTNQFKLRVPLPAVTTLSVYHDMTARWALMGTLAYDQWSILRAYYAKNYIQPPTDSNPSGLIDVTVPQNMRDTVDISIGTHYKLSDCLMLRGSLKYEPTPTKDATRDVNFPDAEKLGLNFGARYKLNKTMAVDVIYGHVFTKTVSINTTNPVTAATTQGHTHTDIDLLGAQLVWDIV